MSLYEIFNIHKETVLFSEGGFNVNCTLKPTPEHAGYKLSGFSTFTGCTFSKDGEAFFGDTVEFPQLNYRWLSFTVENAPVDRTLGTVLLRCSAVATQKDRRQKFTRQSGGI